MQARLCRGAILLAAATAAGCGGSHRAAPPRPLIGHALAQRLATLSDTVATKLAAGDGCGAHAAATLLRKQTMAAIDRRAIPRSLQFSLLSAADDLVDRTYCSPTVPAPQPPPPTAPEPEPEHGHGNGKANHQGHRKGNDKGHGHGHGHGKGHDHGGGD